MKTFNKLMLVLLVVAFPAASWYYLNSGLNYRKAALKELTPKGIWEHKDIVHDSLIKGKTTVVFADPNLITEMNAIYKQFHKGKSFQILQLTKDASINELWNEVQVKQEAIDDIFREGKKIFLLDTMTQLRYAYNESSLDMKKVVEHIAIALPRQKDSDIKMIKRNGGE